jgi:hypothetical protein
MADRLARFYIKSRAGIQFTPKGKYDILYSGNGLCSCGKIGSMKHLISCCPYRASHMTKRPNNVGRILVQAIEANNRKKLVKSISGQFIHWNRELRLPDEVRNPKPYPSVFNRDQSKRRPDIWYYSREDKGERKELALNLIEITIPWNDAEINPEKFKKGKGDKNYKLRPFKKDDIKSSTLADVRSRKIEKYEPENH